MEIRRTLWSESRRTRPQELPVQARAISPRAAPATRAERPRAESLDAGRPGSGPFPFVGPSPPSAARLFRARSALLENLDSTLDPGRRRPHTSAATPDSSMRWTLAHRSTLFIALLVGLPVATPGADKSRADRTPTFSSEVSLVSLPVFVTDKKGKALPGLGPEDFELYEDGKRVPVVSFQYIDTTPRRNKSSSARPPPPAGASCSCSICPSPIPAACIAPRTRPARSSAPGSPRPTSPPSSPST